MTKNALVARDLDILEEMAGLGIVNVAISITTLDADLVRTMEPRTSTPAARLPPITQLSQARGPVAALVAPVTPGLNDHAIPTTFGTAAEAGACGASYILLRLPLAVRPVFLDWLSRTQRLRKDRIESRIRSTRNGRLPEWEFGSRMSGRGEMAERLRPSFQLFARRAGLNRPLLPLETSKFRPPPVPSGQRRPF